MVRNKKMYYAQHSQAFRIWACTETKVVILAQLAPRWRHFARPLKTIPSFQYRTDWNILTIVVFDSELLAG
mgnify:CR=1 FL=1